MILTGMPLWRPGDTKSWYAYRFTTSLNCPLGCGPGAHPLYTGYSCRPDLRYDQHVDKPWFPYHDGFDVYRDATGAPIAFNTEADAKAYESFLIVTELPLGNLDENWGNPHRWDFGQPERGHRVLVQRRGGQRQRPRGWLTRRRLRGPRRWVKPAGLVGAWAGSTLGLWAVGGAQFAGWHGLQEAALCVSLLFMGVWWKAGGRRRRPRRRA